MKKVKARDHAIHNEGVGKAKAQLAKKMAQLEKEGRVLAAEEKEAANKEVAQEVKKALVAAKISNRLTEKREALIQLLQKKPENKADRKANETKATELQTEIFNLNELSFAVEAGEALSAEEADTFAVTVDSRFSIAEGETAAEGAQRLAGELDALQKEVSSAKVRAAEAENSLMAEVNRGTTAVSAKPDAAPATLTASPIPQVSSLEKLAESVAEESAKPVQDPETLEKAKVALVEETTRAMVMVKVDKRLARMREDLGNLVAAKASSPVAKVEMEAQATALLKKIQGMEKMSNRLEQGENLSPEITSKFLAGTPLLASEPGETAAQSAARLAQTASQLRTEISQARRVSAQAEQKLQQSLEQSPLTELKKEAAKSADLERAENCVARQLKEFLTSGKNPDSQAVWEVKKIVAEDVQRATAGINIGKKLTSLGEELAAVDSYPSSPDTSQRRQKLQEDVLRLKSLAQAIDNGEPVSDKKFQPYVEELPKNFQISGEKVSPEEYEKVIQSIRDLNEEAVEVKRGAIEALKGLDLSPPAVNLSPVGPIGEPETLTSSPAEEDLKRMVSGDDGKLAQAGVYAATILRSFGYEKTEFEKDMVLAALLWRHPPEQVATGFSPTVTIFHQAAHDPQANTDILVQDLGQAIRLANLYVEMPGVITGKFSIDPEIFHRLCEDLKKSEPTDHENLERARQGIVSVLSESERAKLIALSKDAYQSVGKWKQTLSKAS